MSAYLQQLTRGYNIFKEEILKLVVEKDSIWFAEVWNSLLEYEKTSFGTVSFLFMLFSKNCNLK